MRETYEQLRKRLYGNKYPLGWRKFYVFVEHENYTIMHIAINNLYFETYESKEAELEGEDPIADQTSTNCPYNFPPCVFGRE